MEAKKMRKRFQEKHELTDQDWIDLKRYENMRKSSMTTIKPLKEIKVDPFQITNEKVISVKERVEGREYEIEIEPKAEDAKMAITMSLVYPDNKQKYSLPNLWKKNGYTSEVLKHYIVINLTAYEKGGNLRSEQKINPTLKEIPNQRGELKGLMVIDFENMLEITAANANKLVDMVVEKYHQPTVKDYIGYCTERGLEPKYAENLFQYAEWVKQNE